MLTVNVKYDFKILINIGMYFVQVGDVCCSEIMNNPGTSIVQVWILFLLHLSAKLLPDK